MTRTAISPRLIACLGALGALIAFLADLLLNGRLPLLGLVPSVIGAAVAVALALRKPTLALAVGVATPFLAGLASQTLMVMGSAGMLGAACLASWRTSPQSSRRAAGVIASLGGLTLTTMLAFAPPSPSTRSVALAVVSATAVGVTGALVRPSEKTIVLCLGSIAIAMSIAVLTSPQLDMDRGAAVLGENANGAGFVAGLGFVAAFTLLWRPHPVGKVSGAIGVALCGAGVLASGSRGALFAACAGAAALPLRRMARARPVRALIAVLVAVALVPLAGGPMMDQFLKIAGREQSHAQANTGYRLQALDFALRQGMDHPLTGVGLGQLDIVAHSDPRFGIPMRAHNVFVGIWAESGAVTLLALLLLSAIAWRRAWHMPSDLFLPLVVSVLAGGLFLEWWGASRPGPLALFVLGAAAGSRQAVPLLSTPGLRGKI